MNKIIEDIRLELIQNSEEQTRISGERFFREAVRLYGIRSAVVSRIGKEHFKRLKDKRKLQVFDFCEELWQSGYMEESFIACNWSYAVHKEFLPGDIKIFERWVNDYVTNWATCDTLCNHTVGTLVEMYPDKINELKKWTASDNRWMRRAASVSLIVPARKGRFLNDIFDISSKLMTDSDDMVQKGYGWMLKAASQAHMHEVYDFVIKNKAIMPRRAYRYAIEKMPPDLRAEAMKK
jgi:3-methyladenine DNA glycosylase AlkD